MKRILCTLIFLVNSQVFSQDIHEIYKYLGFNSEIVSNILVNTFKATKNEDIQNDRCQSYFFESKIEEVVYEESLITCFNDMNETLTFNFIQNPNVTIYLFDKFISEGFMLVEHIELGIIKDNNDIMMFLVNDSNIVIAIKKDKNYVSFLNTEIMKFEVAKSWYN